MCQYRSDSWYFWYLQKDREEQDYVVHVSLLPDNSYIYRVEPDYVVDISLIPVLLLCCRTLIMLREELRSSTLTEL